MLTATFIEEALIDHDVLSFLFIKLFDLLKFFNKMFACMFLRYGRLCPGCPTAFLVFALNTLLFALSNSFQFL